MKLALVNGSFSEKINSFKMLLTFCLRLIELDVTWCGLPFLGFIRGGSKGTELNSLGNLTRNLFRGFFTDFFLDLPVCFLATLVIFFFPDLVIFLDGIFIRRQIIIKSRIFDN
tara:strand:- start:544 stop:882 length:339 start_codon:yes stop_codon:yes gene_type:complete